MTGWIAEYKGVDENEWLDELLTKWSGWEWMTEWIAENKREEENEWLDELLRKMNGREWMTVWIAEKKEWMRTIDWMNGWE